MSRVERVEHMLQAIEYETSLAFDEHTVLLSKNQQLEAENAKLREALRAAWKCAHAGISCSDCRLIAGGCTLQSAMCELGMEVPE